VDLLVVEYGSDRGDGLTELLLDEVFDGKLLSGLSRGD
jgi:hypothetical protein